MDEVLRELDIFIEEAGVPAEHGDCLVEVKLTRLQKWKRLLEEAKDPF